MSSCIRLLVEDTEGTLLKHSDYTSIAEGMEALLTVPAWRSKLMMLNDRRSLAIFEYVCDKETLEKKFFLHYRQGEEIIKPILDARGIAFEYGDGNTIKRF